MIPPRPLLVLVAPLLAGCIEGPCTLSVEWAVLVEIRDAVTGTPIAELARGSVRDGSYVDSLRPHGTLDGVLLSRAVPLLPNGKASIQSRSFTRGM
jgi:hypothetical protein